MSAKLKAIVEKLYAAMCGDGGPLWYQESVEAAVAEAYELGLKEAERYIVCAVLRALDEAAVRNDVLRGKCVVVALEEFALCAESSQDQILGGQDERQAVS